MKNILRIIVGLLFLTSFVFATNISIDSSDRFPAGTTWNSTIEFELSPSSELKIFLDDELITTVFEYNKKAFVDGTQNSNKLLNYNHDNGSITLSLVGLKEGSYTFEAKLYNKRNLIESDSKEIVFYDLEEKVYSLEYTINSQEELINSLKEDLNKKNNQINNLTIQVNELKKDNNVLTSKLVEINSNVRELKENDLDKNASLEKINLGLNKLMKENEEKKIETNDGNNNFSNFNPNLTGLLFFGANPLSIISLIAIISLIVIGAFIYNEKRKNDFLYR